MASTNPIPAGTELSIVIPWAHIKNTKDYIIGIFKDLDWARDILEVKLIYRAESKNKAGRTNPEHNKVFVHFKGLNEQGQLVKQHLSNNGKEIKIDHKYGFWKIRGSTWKFEADFKKASGKPKVEFL